MVVLSFSSFLIMGMGRGVVVINTCGFVPNRRANSKLSHTACGYWNFASSSIHAVSNCGPRIWSDSSPVNVVATAPLGNVSRLFDGS